MSAGYLELFIEQGETFSANVSLDQINGSVYDLSNYTVKSDIKNHIGLQIFQHLL